MEDGLLLNDLLRKGGDGSLMVAQDVFETLRFSIAVHKIIEARLGHDRGGF